MCGRASRRSVNRRSSYTHVKILLSPSGMDVGSQSISATRGWWSTKARGAHQLKGVPEQWELYQFMYDTQSDS